MKIILYCQHVLGIGHFFRSLEICKALAGHEVILVTGGSRINTPLPVHVREVHLPELMMDQQFSGLYAAEEGKSVAEVKKERQKRLFNLFAAEAPDLFPATFQAGLFHHISHRVQGRATLFPPVRMPNA